MAHEEQKTKHLFLLIRNNKGHIAEFPHLSVKEAVLSANMRSTGKWMRISPEFPRAFAMAQIVAGQTLPLTIQVLLSFNDLTKPG
ncbi:hypothetical protein Bca4012_026840 [Brassica carinata]